MADDNNSVNMVNCNKNVILSVRVSAEEKEAYAAVAAIRGISVSELIRELLNEERMKYRNLSISRQKAV